MKTECELTAIIERDGKGYVSLCPELDVASQGDTIEEARANLIEALELFFETASPQEMKDRFHEKSERNNWRMQADPETLVPPEANN